LLSNSFLEFGFPSSTCMAHINHFSRWLCGRIRLLYLCL